MTIQWNARKTFRSSDPDGRGHPRGRLRASRRCGDPWPYSLQRLSLFADCSLSQLDGLGCFLTGVIIKPGATVMREHGYGSEFVIIEDGFLGVSQGHDIETRLLSVLGSGDFVGEIALLERAPRTATVTALTQVTAYVSTADEFRGLLARAPSLEEKVIAAEIARSAANLLAAH